MNSENKSKIKRPIIDHFIEAVSISMPLTIMIGVLVKQPGLQDLFQREFLKSHSEVFAVNLLFVTLVKLLVQFYDESEPEDADSKDFSEF